MDPSACPPPLQRLLDLPAPKDHLGHTLPSPPPLPPPEEPNKGSCSYPIPPGPLCPFPRDPLASFRDPQGSRLLPPGSLCWLLISSLRRLSLLSDSFCPPLRYSLLGALSATLGEGLAPHLPQVTALLLRALRSTEGLVVSAVL